MQAAFDQSGHLDRWLRREAQTLDLRAAPGGTRRRAGHRAAFARRRRKGPRPRALGRKPAGCRCRICSSPGWPRRRSPARPRRPPLQRARGQRLIERGPAAGQPHRPQPRGDAAVLRGRHAGDRATCSSAIRRWTSRPSRFRPARTCWRSSRRAARTRIATDELLDLSPVPADDEPLCRRRRSASRRRHRTRRQRGAVGRAVAARRARAQARGGRGTSRRHPRHTPRDRRPAASPSRRKPPRPALQLTYDRAGPRAVRAGRRRDRWARRHARDSPSGSAPTAPSRPPNWKRTPRARTASSSSAC